MGTDRGCPWMTAGDRRLQGMSGARPGESTEATQGAAGDWSTQLGRRVRSVPRWPLASLASARRARAAVPGCCCCRRARPRADERHQEAGRVTTRGHVTTLGKWHGNPSRGRGSGQPDRASAHGRPAGRPSWTGRQGSAHPALSSSTRTRVIALMTGVAIGVDHRDRLFRRRRHGPRRSTTALMLCISRSAERRAGRPATAAATPGPHRAHLRPGVRRPPAGVVHAGGAVFRFGGRRRQSARAGRRLAVDGDRPPASRPNAGTVLAQLPMLGPGWVPVEPARRRGARQASASRRASVAVDGVDRGQRIAGGVLAGAKRVPDRPRPIGGALGDRGDRRAPASAPAASGPGWRPAGGGSAGRRRRVGDTGGTAVRGLEVIEGSGRG